MSTAAQPQLLQLAAAEACSRVVWTLKGSVTAAQLDDAEVGRTVDIDIGKALSKSNVVYYSSYYLSPSVVAGTQ